MKSFEKYLERKMSGWEKTIWKILFIIHIIIILIFLVAPCGDALIWREKHQT